MKDLPKLINPYYTLAHTLQRLRPRTELSEEEDLLLLARDKQLEMCLLCDKRVALIPKELADKKALELGIELPFLVSHWGTLDKNLTPSSVEIAGSANSEGLSCLDGIDKPFTIYPLKLPQASVGEMYSTNWLTSRSTPTLRMAATLFVGGIDYYACDMANSQFFHCLVTEEEPAGDFHSNVFEGLIGRGNYIVTKEAITKFEERYAAAKLPRTTQGKRLVRLQELIDDVGIDILIPLGRLGVWRELTSRDPYLFPYREKVDDTIKGFFKSNKLISFK